MELIIYDFEVFPHDTLLGYAVVNFEHNELIVKQTWDLDEMKQVYKDHEEDIWIGHNNYAYDDLILDAVLRDKPVYETSRDIIDNNRRALRKVPKYSYDLMFHARTAFSLKTTELLDGKDICECEIDFHTQHALFDNERASVEAYNRMDLQQTFDNFIRMNDNFQLRMSLISEFGLPLTALSASYTKLAAQILGAKQNLVLKYKAVPPREYNNLVVENDEVLRFYYNEKFRTDEKLTVDIGGAEITIGAGGCHSALKKYRCDKALYIDVSGYYNLIMILYDLFPRSIPDEGKDKYRSMYYSLAELKKTDPLKREIYKRMLLSVAGATKNEHTDFFDPQIGSMIFMTSQLFIVDLIEKLSDLCTIVQVNTDGIIVDLKDWSDIDKVTAIIEEWEARTGFNMKKQFVYDLHQRDVNCYFCRGSDGEIIFKGEAVKNYDISDNAFAECAFFACKEPPVIAQGVINYCLNGIYPEAYIEAHKADLRLYQYICKTNSFDYLQYDFIGSDNFEIHEKINNVSRAFALKREYGIGTITKHKDDKSAKVSSLPPSVVVENHNIYDKTVEMNLMALIDYDYYAERIWARIGEFIGVDRLC